MTDRCDFAANGSVFDFFIGVAPRKTAHPKLHQHLFNLRKVAV